VTGQAKEGAPIKPSSKQVNKPASLDKTSAIHRKKRKRKEIRDINQPIKAHIPHKTSLLIPRVFRGKPKNDHK
jgi:hypothetical protein